MLRQGSGFAYEISMQEALACKWGCKWGGQGFTSCLCRGVWLWWRAKSSIFKTGNQAFLCWHCGSWFAASCAHPRHQPVLTIILRAACVSSEACRPVRVNVS
jgi:hypothetical protein